MSWCDHCSKYHPPTALDDGACPACGEQVDLADGESPDAPDEIVGETAPWHFWVVVVLLIAYIVWRIVDLIRALV